MCRVVEISLDAPAVCVKEWVQQTLGDAAGKRPAARRTKRGAPEGGVGVALEDALARTARLSPVSARTPLALYPLPLDGGLRAAGWRAVVEASPDGQRLTVSHCDPHAPAVTIREIVCDVPLEAGVPAEQRDTLPSELLAVLDAASDVVSSAAPLELQRTIWRWVSEDGHAVDVVLNDAPTAGSPFCEVVLTSRCDDNDGDAPADGARQAPLTSALHALFAAADELINLLPLFPQLDTALERGGREAHDEQPARAVAIDLSGVRTPHAALIAIGGNVAQQWFGNERGVRETVTIEFVHQMRVAQRRLRTALRIFSAWADANWTGRVAPGLTWLGDLLGDARDLDVFTDSTLPALAAADTDASTWSDTLAAADARRLEARERLQAAMRSRRYAQLSLGWLAWLADLPLRGAPEAVSDIGLHEFVSKRVRKHFRHLADAAKLTELDAATRHRHRIEAKRLRYILEFFESLASTRTQRDVARTLQRIQSVLGDGNDAAVALRFLETLGVTPYQLGFARGWSQAVSRCTAQEGERLLRALEKPRIKDGA